MNASESVISENEASTRKISTFEARPSDIDVVNQGVGTQDLGELSLETSPLLKTDPENMPV
jgi:hypothetical protein